MVTAGLIVRLEAKAGKGDELAAFLADALSLVQDEPETVAWLQHVDVLAAKLPQGGEP
jgi:hypothetical protein